MKMRIAAALLLGSSMLAALLLGSSMLAAQSTQSAAGTPEAHVDLARAAAGEDYQNLFNFMCAPGGARGGRGAAPGGAGAPQGARGPGAAPAAGAPRGAAPRGGAQRGAPDRSTWYAEPVKVFDNLYFLGQSEYSVWALQGSDGFILLDAIFDYSVEEEVDGGMKKLGLDPSKIKYAVLSHAHPDHFGGGKFLQDKYGARAIMSAADWDEVEKTNGAKPKRDMVATDGQKLTLGDVSVTMYLTPGHTPGTISSIFQVKDNGRSHTVALWGGTGLNADKATLTQYVESAKRFAEIARQAGATIILSNHTDWDRSKVNLPMLAKRAAGTPNPYVTDAEHVRRYLKVAEECATSRLLRLP